MERACFDCFLPSLAQTQAGPAPGLADLLQPKHFTRPYSRHMIRKDTPQEFVLALSKESLPYIVSLGVRNRRMLQRVEAFVGRIPHMLKFRLDNLHDVV